MHASFTDARRWRGASDVGRLAGPVVPAGAAISVAGHAALIALALWGLPWFDPRPRKPVPAVAVRLVSPGELAAIEAARDSVEQPEPPAAAPAQSTPAPREPPAAASPAPADPAPPPDAETALLAPAFDPDAPLGSLRPQPLGVPLAAPPPPAPAMSGRLPVPPPAAAARPPGARPLTRLPLLVARPPRPRSDRPAGDTAVASWGNVGPAAVASSANLPGGDVGREAYRAAVRAAIAGVQVYPRAARDREIEGVAVLRLVVGRDGHLRTARLMDSSGSAVLDQAGLDAARRASLPVPPPELRGAELDLEIPLRFEITAD